MSEASGFRAATELYGLTSDPGLHLLSNTGATIKPMRPEGAHYSFMLPGGTRFVRLVSHAIRPVDVFGPLIGDLRLLGVFVGNITFTMDKHPKKITIQLEDTQPDGWYTPDKPGFSWTNGNALLPLQTISQGKMGILSFDVQAGGPYIMKDSQV